MAIVNNEAAADACAAVLETDDRLLISAASLAEALIVAAGRNVEATMANLIFDLGLEIVPVDETRARLAADAYRRWGKGMHPARLNFGDCFAYALAREYDCPLLFVGDDFSRTDVTAALA